MFRKNNTITMRLHEQLNAETGFTDESSYNRQNENIGTQKFLESKPILKLLLYLLLYHINVYAIAW